MKQRMAIGILLIAGHLGGWAGGGSLEGVYDRFIQHFADGNPAWKTEITLPADLNHPPIPPYRLHYHDSLGFYQYRPKRWAELDAYERFALANDPRLSHFIREHMAIFHAGHHIPATTDGTEPGKANPNDSGNGLLKREDQNTWSYRFEPKDLLHARPFRLVEITQ